MEEHILRYADIDTRRALGVYQRLPVRPFDFRPIPPVSVRYWPEKKMVMYTNFYADEYMFTVYRGTTLTNEGSWTPCEISETSRNERGDYTFFFTYADRPFRFVGIPDVAVVSRTIETYLRE
jgi:hypothetical protein